MNKYLCCFKPPSKGKIKNENNENNENRKQSLCCLLDSTILTAITIVYSRGITPVWYMLFCFPNNVQFKVHYHGHHLLNVFSFVILKNIFQVFSLFFRFSCLKTYFSIKSVILAIASCKNVMEKGKTKKLNKKMKLHFLGSTPFQLKFSKVMYDLYIFQNPYGI